MLNRASKRSPCSASFSAACAWPSSKSPTLASALWVTCILARAEALKALTLDVTEAAREWARVDKASVVSSRRSCGGMVQARGPICAGADRAAGPQPSSAWLRAWGRQPGGDMIWRPDEALDGGHR
jgi:hypothetical protein